MASIKYNCPHCQTHSMSCEVDWKYEPPSRAISGRHITPFAYIGVVCAECLKPVIFEMKIDAYMQPSHFSTFIQKFRELSQALHAINDQGVRLRLVEVTSDIAIPEHLSVAVSKAFRAAERNFTALDCEDASATMYRRAIDVAIRESYPSINGILAARITKLSDEQIIPQAMKDWADHIRWIGNDGAHEPEGVTQTELSAIRNFTDAFLRYLVTMPIKVRIARGELNPDGSPVEPQASE